MCALRQIVFVPAIALFTKADAADPRWVTPIPTRRWSVAPELIPARAGLLEDRGHVG